MGVMSCSRSYCNNIMCDTYVSSIGYICDECEKEFQEYLDKQGIMPTTEGEIKMELQKFMATDKGVYNKGKEMRIDDFFNKHRRQ